jgi:2-keto-4-pentenoate hydratase/2-oxohepta-3-ene-1,7-dioic acid hydratase in catechol pathway
MRIVRYVNEQSQIRFGIEKPDATVVEMDAGPLHEGRETGKVATVRRILCPVDPVPAIFGIGLNYRKHAMETGAPIPERPAVFMKSPASIQHPGGPIVIPAACTHGPEVDYECELAVVIGKAARNVGADDALDHVLGYTCGNDVSARRWQKHSTAGQWIRGKSFDTFCPLGPALVTADEIGDPQSLPIRTILNGRTMQESNTSDMIMTVANLIAELSMDMTLLPGTVIMTGTPEGVGFVREPPVFLKPGDVVSIEIDGIGVLKNPVQGADP